ncbi:phage GP46 family protein [Pseudomonas taiwanensis]|uniref:phage GP46 family protein n=1 Tax=Pseudomonas taiwanensis TaxID=470150 RepID=UPI00192D27AA|nr:phage GP46 family protein [Pseudomonas taiwanensis]
MADAAMIMTEFGGDLVLFGFDLQRDDGLETAVIISLFTDRRASAEQIPPEYPQDDLRGYWGDIANASDADQTGSLLWLLAREKQLPKVLSRAEQYCREALAWMIDDLIATSISVEATFYSMGVMLLVIDIDRPGGTSVRYRFNYEWAAQAAKRAA